jgi:hypothetical protein
MQAIICYRKSDSFLRFYCSMVGAGGLRLLVKGMACCTAQERVCSVRCFSWYPLINTKIKTNNLFPSLSLVLPNDRAGD